MHPSIPFNTDEKELGDSEKGRSTQSDLRNNADTPKLVACLLLVPQDAEAILRFLQRLAVSGRDLSSIKSTIDANASMQLAPEESWLSHSQAAAFLGVSKSTLYHYSCHDQIERRKLGGRLEYRRSALDRFKDAHTLPASGHSTSARIIASAHSSGK